MEGITLTHEHPLIFNEDVKIFGGQEVLCYGCKKPISGPSIGCTQCEIVVHKACAELPKKIKHPRDPHHHLSFCASSPYPEGVTSLCDTCGEICDGFHYSCPICEIEVDMICAFEKRELVHASHHHPMLLLQRKMEFSCDACYIKKSDCCYLCVTCQYCIHKSCAKSPSTIDVAEHGHPLTLVFSLVGLTNFLFHDCDICLKPVSKSSWNYSCLDCHFVAHLHCATESRREGTEAEANLDPNLLRLPLATDFDLIKDFIRRNKFDTYLVPCRDHGNHLCFHFKPPKTTSSKTVKLTCEACALPISTPFYCCTRRAIEIPRMRSSCNYFVHEVCSRLPNEIQHPCHPEHPLIQGRPESSYRVHICQGCDQLTTGLVYGCESCNFVLCVKCASLPATILHDAHKHPLVQGHSSSNFYCRACGQSHSGFRFKCESCEDYYVALRCVKWSRSTSHRWDDHPLRLTYSRIKHPQEFICDKCEVEIHPQLWFYHCKECDNTFHPYCMPQYDFWSNVKFGAILQHEKHPHPLAFRRRSKIRYIVECKWCREKLEDSPVFECTEGCDFGICRKCLAGEHWN